MKKQLQTFWAVIGLLMPMLSSLAATQDIKPDIVVAADGSGDFTNVQAAVASIPTANRERQIILVKDGVYREKVRVDAPFITLRGESRKGTRIEFPQLYDDFQGNPDDIGRAVINLSDTAADFVLENMTVENTAGQVGPHAFTIYGRADKTVIVDCDVLSHGADTVSLWRGDSGRYYHARCNFRGSVDFVCPRGWCYIVDSTFYEMKPGSAAVWHDGSKNKDMKFVMRNCKFDGTNDWVLARHHHDAQFYFLDCEFSSTMRDRAPLRVRYPLSSSEATEADIKRNADLDKSNVWGERAYFHNARRDGGNYPWMADNLSTAEGSPVAQQITAAWTFGGKWNPERKTGPVIRDVRVNGMRVDVRFSEPVTVKGSPWLSLRPGGAAPYISGSGTDTLVFTASTESLPDVASVNVSTGAIIATEAAATLLPASLTLP
ncbi:MAG TPA: pectinesterase family protein [Verrucomicrobiota bacterium]|nr:pectinesterase family protein [Verrucomicrobiota bacterium]